MTWTIAPCAPDHAAEISAALGVDNLTDEHYWVYHPYAGRTWFGELRWEL